MPEFKVGDKVQWRKFTDNDISKDTVFEKVYTIASIIGSSCSVSWEQEEGFSNQPSTTMYPLDKFKLLASPKPNGDTWFTVSDPAEEEALIKHAKRLGIEYKVKTAVFFREVNKEEK